MNSQLPRLCREEGAGLIEVNKLTRDLICSDGVHYSAAGAACVATKLAHVATNFLG